jgi:hypothetical protein
MANLEETPMIILPRTITRSFVKAHPEWNFVHGHDVQKKGFFGHASIYNEPNTFALPTMYKFCASGARYFTDADNDAKVIVYTAICKIPTDKPVVVLRGIGTGCSRLRELAPHLYNEMMNRLLGLETEKFGWSMFENGFI